MNINDYLSKQLKEGEEVEHIIRRYPVVLVPAIVFGSLAILADFFLLYWWFHHRPWGPAAFVVVLVLAIIFAGRQWYMWTMNILVVTNQRVIDISQQGVFHRQVAETSYDKIQDIRYTTHGLWQTLMTFGTITIQTAGASTTLELTNIKNPSLIQQQITDLQRAATGTATVSRQI